MLSGRGDEVRQSHKTQDKQKDQDQGNRDNRDEANALCSVLRIDPAATEADEAPKHRADDAKKVFHSVYLVQVFAGEERRVPRQGRIAKVCAMRPLRPPPADLTGVTGV